MTAATETQVRLAARMYEARTATKTMLGDKFKERMDEYGKVLQAIAARESIELLAAANLACRLVDNPYTQIQLMAAVVELVEPSTP